MLRPSLFALAAAVGTCLAACSGGEFGSSGEPNGVTDGGGNPTEGGAGSTSSAGGAQHSGGSGSNAGGSGGRSGDGGATSGTGGRTGQGGTSSGGSATDASAGGQPGSGGASGSGGATGNGGVANTGGTGGAAGAGGGIVTLDGSTCSDPTTWYPDNDQDQYGRSSGAVVSCSAPADGHWATIGGDCNDDEGDVHPNATQGQDQPYQTSGGTTSFDYDCSGQEEGNPNQEGAAPACGVISLCSGSGFVKTSRTGTGVNPLCGSTTKATCVLNGLLCASAFTTVSTGYLCH